MSGRGRIGGSALQPSAQAALALLKTVQSSVLAQPVIFNATTSVRPGDVIYVQGANFDSASAYIELNGSALPTLIRQGSYLLMAQVPRTAGNGKLSIRVCNPMQLSSAPRIVNGAVIRHLDASELHPSGAFRVFGRNLLLPGYTPAVTVQGLACAINLAASNEHKLVCTAPAGITNSASVTVTADNGNGAGPSTLSDRTISVSTTGVGDPHGLGVGWGANFSGWTVVPITTLVTGGVTDNATAFAAAVAAAPDYSILTVPAGLFRLSAGANPGGRKVLQGAGIGQTIFVAEGANSVWSNFGGDLIGMRDMTIRRPATATGQMLLKQCTRCFLVNVRIEYLGTAPRDDVFRNAQFVIRGAQFSQNVTANASFMYLGESKYLVYEGCSVDWNTGSAIYAPVCDSSVIAGNALTWNRPARVGTTHGISTDFVQRCYLADNTFTATGTNTVATNDGEMILSEGGGGVRTEDYGTATSATSTTLTDTTKTLTPATYLRFDGDTPQIHPSYTVFIIAGMGMGQSRKITAYNSGTKTLTVASAWDVTPDATSRYAVGNTNFEWSVIRGNTFSNVPRSIWSYQQSVLELDVTDNTGTDCTGVYVRTVQDQTNHLFCCQWGLRLARNIFTNVAGGIVASSPAVHVIVNGTNEAFGLGLLGIQYRGEEIRAKSPNGTSANDYCSDEGWKVGVGSEMSNYADTRAAALGVVYQDCKGTNFDDAALRVQSGAWGALVVDPQVTNSARFVSVAFSGPVLATVLPRETALLTTI